MLANLELESAERVSFVRIGQSSDLSGRPGFSGALNQRFEPRSGYDADDVLEELRFVAETEGWKLDQQPRPEPYETWCGEMSVGGEVDVLFVERVIRVADGDLPVLTLRFSSAGTC